MNNSMSAAGKLIRMKRIFREDGCAVMVAINHGLGMGPLKGIEYIDKILHEIIPEGIDSLTIHKGNVVKYTKCFAGKTALVLKVTNITKYYEPFEIPIASVEEAVALGADAIAIGLSLCGEREDESIRLASEYVKEAEKYGILTIAHSYPNGNFIRHEERYSVENVGYATRVALELGIDIIKTYWTGSVESFEKIVKLGSPAKVVLSGGPKCDTIRECFEMTYQCMQAGAHGIVYGRNIWQHDFPAAVVRGLNAIVHCNASVDEAMDIASESAGVKLL